LAVADEHGVVVCAEMSRAHVQKATVKVDLDIEPRNSLAPWYFALYAPVRDLLTRTVMGLGWVLGPG
jgi:hypothetical protein